MPPRVSVRLAARSPGEDSPILPLASKNPNSHRPSGMASRKTVKDMEIHIDQVDKALFPLNLFPTHDELQEMHEKYVSNSGSSDKVTLLEFISMVEHLKFAKIDDQTRLNLFRMYKNGCGDDNRGLNRGALQSLLLSMGAEHSPEEIDHIMADWDLHGTERLTFDAFLSIVALDLKEEEKEGAFAKDYERFCPHFVRDSDIEDDSQRITVKNLRDVFKDLSVPISKNIAEEMIFDADLSKLGGRVSYDDLIATITIIHAKEIYEALQNQKGLASAHEQDKTMLYKSMMGMFDQKEQDDP